MKNMSCILIVTLLAAGASAQSRPHWTATPRSEVEAEKRRIAKLSAKKAIPAVASDTPINLPPKEPQPEIVNKLKRGLKKSQVLALFENPKSASTDMFAYKDGSVCEYSEILCFIQFNVKGRVESWSSIKPGMSSDLDDLPEPIQKKSIPPRRRQAIRTPDSFSRSPKNSTTITSARWTEDRIAFETAACAKVYSTFSSFNRYKNKLELSTFACVLYMDLAIKGVAPNEFKDAIRISGGRSAFFRNTQVNDFFNAARAYIKPIEIDS